MSSFVDLVIRVDELLSAARLDHAFGGALALMQHVAEPRATWDIDVNVSVGPERAGEVLSALSEVATHDEEHLARLVTDRQVRIFAGRYPIDIFLAAHEFHDDLRLAVTRRHFGPTQLPYVSATHLTVLKALFDRPKDWVDIQEMLWAGTVDVERSLGWLVRLLGDDDRIPRLRAMALAPRPIEPSVSRYFDQS